MSRLSSGQYQEISSIPALVLKNKSTTAASMCHQKYNNYQRCFYCVFYLTLNRFEYMHNAVFPPLYLYLCGSRYLNMDLIVLTDF